jgi:translation initiation factor IF-3
VEALSLAEKATLDLVEISPQSSPPVCRIMDYGRYQFQQKKKRVEAKKKQKQFHVKEVKFRPTTETGDYQVKLRNIERFLSAGDKAKVTIWFRGREMVHRDLGTQLLNRVAADLNHLAIVEQDPKQEGRQMTMVFSPKKKGMS